MTFSECLSIIKYKLSAQGIDINPSDYDGAIVKRLAATNTLDENKPGNQTHIAITGEQMDIFPFVSSYGYLESEYDNRDENLKRYFITRITVSINEMNCDYLLSKTETPNPTPIVGFEDGVLESHTCVFRSKRKDAADQTQVSLKEKDDISFVNFRKLINTNDYLIVLKHKQQIIYSMYGIKNMDSDGLDSLKDKFYKDNTNTLVDNTCVITDQEYTVEELGNILKEMYENYKSTGQVAAIQMFGFKYGAIIDKKGYSCAKILAAAGMGNTKYDAEINKGVNVYRSVLANEYGIKFVDDEGLSFSQCWERLIKDVAVNNNILIIRLPRTTHTLEYDSDNKRFKDTAYQDDSPQYIYKSDVESVYLGTYEIHENSGSNKVTYTDSKAIIDEMVNRYGLSNGVEDINITSWHNTGATDEEYHLFKGLLAYFVNQLNINNGLIDGEFFVANGGEERGIQKIRQWNRFNGFNLSCRFARGYQKNQDMASYLNYFWVNLNPHFNDETLFVESLGVNVKPGKKIISQRDNYSVDSLDLYSDESPSENLKLLFNDLRDEIYKWQRGDYNNDNTVEEVDQIEQNEEIDLINAYSYKSVQSTGGVNHVVYGTPGCGKSYYVKNTLLKKEEIDEKNVFRTTFFQDYSNTDFIGQIVPTVKYEKENENGNDKSVVTYSFVPGPFTKALECAIANPTKKVALVIEELNRGNAPSIFGDLFQLLDRTHDGKNGYPIGTSEYEIVNVSLLNYLKDNDPRHYNKEYKYSFNLDEIRIPANLYIYATMNTSDQNVFTLDTAFKRRWDFEKLDNEFDSNHEYADFVVPGMTPAITWKDFVTKINNYIIKDNDLLTSEDKQLGVYFVGKEMLIDLDGQNIEEINVFQDAEKVKKFAYKVFEYLWNDVAKFSRPNWFGNTSSLDELIKNYIGEKPVINEAIFKQTDN